MLVLLLLTALLVAVCFVIGQAVLGLCGWPRWRWWAPAVGYAVLLICGGQVVRVPGRATTAFVAMAVLAVAALLVPFVWKAIRDAGPEAALVGAGMILIAAVPFFAAGHAGVLGAGLSNDMSQHLLGAFYIRTHDSMLPEAAIGGDLISTGYPLGPHGLTAALTAATGVGEERTFSAVTLAMPALTGLAALGVVPEARRGARWALALVVGIGYLPAAYLAQGLFKETSQALLVLAAAVALTDLVRLDSSRGVRRGIPLGLLAGGAVYTYSYAGAFWIIGTAGLVFVTELARRPRAWRATIRWAVAPAAGAVVAGALAVIPEIGRMSDFANSILGSEPKENRGNLFHALNPLETLGVWLTGDFRVNPRPYWLSIVLSVVALGVLVASLRWWWRRGFALPAAVLVAVVIWIDLALTRNIYNAAKGLAVLAPVLLACLGAPLAAAWSADARSRRPGIAAVRVLGVVLLAAAVVSSAAVLRSAPVGLGQHAAELGRMRPLVQGKAVLFLASDHFAQWELRGANPLYVTGPLYAPAHLGQHPQKYGGGPVDADNYGSRDLDKTRFIVTPGGRYTSEIPPNFRLVLQTPSYALYRRSGETPFREPIEPPGEPGTVFDCASPRGRDYLERYRYAGVLPRPVVRSNWQGSSARPGETASLHVRLPRGRWDVSLQYVSPTGLTVRAPGLRKDLAPSFGVIYAYWPAGTLRSAGRPMTLTVTARERSRFGRRLGRPRRGRAPKSPGNTPLWHAAFTRHDTTPRRRLARSACRRYVDWFAPVGGHMRGRSREAG